MAALTTELAAILRTVVRPGDFYATGTTAVYAPGVAVEGVGVLALPLLPSQAAQLIALAERAPYGRGDETLVDPAIRRVWQIRAEQVRFQGRHWAQSLERMVASVAEGLGVSDPVEAQFYKLLVYDQGSFFVSHRDTEKAPGMFATLIIVLPADYTGGELVLRQKDRTVTLDLRGGDPSEVAFAAFYTDCLHEVRPITAGCRLTLVYNLLRRGDARHALQPPRYEREQARSATLLRRWAARTTGSDADAPTKLIYPLEHAYTPAELSFAALKGADAAGAAVLVAATREADCTLHLALLSIEEWGAAEHTGYDPSRWNRWSEDEDDAYEITEVSERTVTLSDWQRPEGGVTELGPLPVEDEELCPPDALEEMEPDEVSFAEATGNEGASFERTYRRAALVLWPRRQWLAVLTQAGVGTTLPYLAEVTHQWEESDDASGAALWAQAHELSRQMVRQWPRLRPWSYPLASLHGASGDAATMLQLLTRLRDVDTVDAFLTTITADGVYGQGDNEAVLRALRLVGPERAAAVLAQIVAANAPHALGACADLLARAAADTATGSGPLDLRPAATAFIARLPGDPARLPDPAAPWRTPRVDVDTIVNTLSALGDIDAGLADAVVDDLLAWPQTYDMDALLLPALLRLHDQAARRSRSAVRRLRHVCVEHLRARIAQPLEQPRDWMRARTLTCGCARCTLLSQFLADPGQQTWTFKAAEADRQHVEGTIRASGCDVDMVTERQGRPYSLVCTKNQASYERRVGQRAADLAALARLED